LSPPNDHELNSFTLAYFLRALVGGIKLRQGRHEEEGPVVDKVRSAIRQLLETAVQTLPDIHPFVVFHIVRVCRTCLPVVERGSQLEKQVNEGQTLLLEEARRTASFLLARHQVGLLSPCDAVALGFCAATLVQSDDDADNAYVIPALTIFSETQDPSGAWALGRVVTDNKDVEGGRLEISTYEIAWVMADALRELNRRRREIFASPVVRSLLDKLIRAGEYAKKSAVKLAGDRAPNIGWCSDHPYNKPMIESWTSAVVLHFALTLRELVQDASHFDALRSFDSADPRDADWPPWLRWSAYRQMNEPDTDHPILDYINTNMILPILASPRQLPSPEAKTTSALLFGPPGTGKTSIVQAVADGLTWPLVRLSPGEFVRGGMEYIAAQANEIFGRLMRLCRAVVLFDECDELFRNREPSSQSEQTRGIAAFVTASMLPKLQELHDRGRVVYFICTNHLESMDNAVKRGGRVDHVIGVGPPDKELRSRIIRDAVDAIQARDGLARRNRRPRPDALEELAALTEGFTRVELRRAVQTLLRRPDQAGKPAVRALVRKMKEGLTIDTREYNDFERLKQQFSHPHIGGR
jgi:hypothetical protein